MNVINNVYNVVWINSTRAPPARLGWALCRRSVPIPSALDFVAWAGPNEYIFFLGQKWVDPNWPGAGISRSSPCARDWPIVSYKSIQHVLNFKPIVTRMWRQGSESYAHTLSGLGCYTLETRCWSHANALVVDGYMLSWVVITERLPCDGCIYRVSCIPFFTYEKQDKSFHIALIL